jgi:hypothetical protein
MFSESERPHHSSFDTPESGLRFGMMLAEVWHDWFAAMSQVAYQTHRACEFLAENGAVLNRPFEAFDFRSARGQSESANGAVDFEKLKQCLQSLDPMDAAKVMHAVQTMQLMEAMLKKRQSRGEEAEETAW